MPPIDLSIVIPCYNESAVLPLLKTRLLASLNALKLNWEVIFVDDGSRDQSSEIILAMNREDARFKLIGFSRNFGHQAAISAGLNYATGKAVGVIDADLQDPPELFVKCLEKLAEGYDVVYAVRRQRKESFFKRLAYATFYRLLRSIADAEIPLDSGDFCLMSSRVVAVLKDMPERNPFVRGLRAWSGFRQFGLEYDREARAAGDTKYPLRKLFRLAADGVFSFSTFPLQMATWVGFCGLGFSIVYGLFVLTWRIFGFEFMGHRAHELPGWTATVGVTLFMGAIQLLILGLMGHYIGRIYNEVKQRPRWVIRETAGIVVQDGKDSR